MHAALLCVVALCAQESISTRTYDLRTIVAGTAGEDEYVWLRLPLYSIDQIYPDSALPLTEEEAELQFGPDDLVGGILEALEATPGAEVEDFDADDMIFSLTGNAAAHEACARTVDALRAHQHDHVLIEAFRVDRGLLGGSPRAVLSAEDAAALAARATEAPRHVGRARWGRLHTISQASVVQYLQDYDVEVAQFQATADPTVNRVHVGLELGVRVDRAASGDRVIARVWGQNGALRENMRKQRIPAYADVVVEHPYVDASLFSASGAVDPGGALVVDAGDPDGRLLVVRLHAEVQPRHPEDPTVDLAELTAPFLRQVPLELPIVIPSRGLDPTDHEFEFVAAPWAYERPSPQDVLDRITGNGPAVFGFALGASVLVPLPPEGRAALREEVRRLAASEHTATVEFTFAVTEVPPATMGRAVSEPEALAELCEGAAAKWVGAAFSYDTLLLLGGTATTHIQDHDVQVAQAAVAGDPIVKQVFDGTRLWCSPVGVEGGAITAWIDVAHQDGFADSRIVETFLSSPALAGPVAKEFADVLDQLLLTIRLELGKTRPLRGRSLVRLEPETWEIVAAQPFDGDTAVQLIAVKARVVEP